MESAREKELFETAMTGDTRLLEQVEIHEPDILMIAYQEGDTACHVVIEHGQLLEFAWKISFP